VQDTLLISTASQLTGSNYVVVGGGGAGALVTVAGSDVVMPNVYLDGPGGTRAVQGRFRPTTTWFRAATPTSDALQPGLEYGSVRFQGPYHLTQSMPITGSLVVETGTGALDLGGFRLTVPGDVDINSGAYIRMTTPGDSLLTGGHFNLGSDAGTSTLSAGVITVAGDYFYLQKAGSGASGTHTVVLNGTGATTTNVYTASADGTRDIRNLVISTSRAVNFISNTQVSGTMQVLTPTAITTNQLKVGGALSTVSGSVITANGNLELSDASGTSQLLGGYRGNNVTRLLGGASTLLVRNSSPDSIAYRSVEVTGGATVSGGAAVLSGDLSLSTPGASLTLPAGSSIAGNTDVYGSLTFADGGTGGGTLYIHSGGTATANNYTPVDYTTIYMYGVSGTTPAGVLNNLYGSPSSGFRYKSPGGSFYQNGGTVNGQQPSPWPQPPA